MRTRELIIASAVAAMLGLPSGALAAGGEEGMQQEGLQNDQMGLRNDMDASQPGFEGNESEQVRQEDQDYTRGRFGINLSQNQIRDIQQELQSVDSNLEVDGVWGDETVDALKEYQRNHGLEVTGRPDQQTLSRLGINQQQ